MPPYRAEFNMRSLLHSLQDFRLKRIQLEKEAKCTSVKQESTVDRNADINSLPSSKMSMIYNSRESATMSDYLDILKKLDHDDQISINFHVGMRPIQDKNR